MRLIPVLLATGAAFAAVAAVSCSKSQPAKSAVAPAPGGTVAGTVLEVLPATPYTYLRLQTAQGELWVAVPATDAKVGAPVTVATQVKMEKFQSPSLNRTFDAVWFGTIAGAPGSAPAAVATAGAAPALPAHGQAAAAPVAPDEKVAKADGANGRTIADLYAHRTELKDRTVAVKGKIVKYSEGIMGKTWIHLRDGSGDPKARNNDLTLTTKDVAKLGDIVTVKGVVHLDKDLGMGYAYPVLIEDAKLQH